MAELEKKLNVERESNASDMIELKNKLSLQESISIELGTRLKKHCVAKVDVSTETFEESFKSPPMDERNEDNREDHTNLESSSKVKTAVQRGKKEEAKAAVTAEAGILVYRCEDCGMTTKKKSSFLDHKAEFCVKEAVKDMLCSVCKKPHTRRSLRVHLGGMVRSLTQGRTLRGEHAKYTLEQHQALLDSVKLK